MQAVLKLLARQEPSWPLIPVISATFAEKFAEKGTCLEIKNVTKFQKN
jgi:hypothetical protein